MGSRRKAGTEELLQPTVNGYRGPRLIPPRARLLSAAVGPPGPIPARLCPQTSPEHGAALGSLLRKTRSVEHDGNSTALPPRHVVSTCTDKQQAWRSPVLVNWCRSTRLGLHTIRARGGWNDFSMRICPGLPFPDRKARLIYSFHPKLAWDSSSGKRCPQLPLSYWNERLSPQKDDRLQRAGS